MLRSSAYSTKRPGAASWLSRIFPLGLLLAAAVVVGNLINKPNRRVIQSAAAGLLIYIASRLNMYQSLSFFFVVYPYPTTTSVGSTSTLILLAVAILYAMRVATGELKIEFKSLGTPLIPVIAAGYLLSTYSIDTEEAFRGGVGILFDWFACVSLYYMIVNFVRDEVSLRRLLYFLGISSILIHTVAVYEVIFPGRAFLEGWLLSQREGFLHAKFGVRTGGPFRDFELLSEYCAVTTPMFGFLFIRAPRGAKLFYGVVLGMTIFSLFAAVTRGGFISLTVGLIYLFVLLRKELGVVRSAAMFVTVITMILSVGYVLPKLFHVESLFERLGRTRLEKGLPDSRADTWTRAYHRGWEKPILGHGPYYTFGGGLVKYSWPHNGYLFLWVTIGLTGLVGYVAFWLVCFFASGMARGNYLSGPFVPGFLTAMHVSWLIFMVDQAKIDFARNPIYFQFTWMWMGLTAAAWRIAREEREQSMARAVAPDAAPATDSEPVPAALSEALPATLRPRKIFD